MKSSYLFVTMLLAGSNFCGSAVAQQSTTTIEELQYTDSKLTSCITQTALDNGWEFLREIAALSCENLDIESAQGIERLAGLTFLNLSGNQLTEIDLSSNINLTSLLLMDNQLTTIDVSANTELNNLWLSENQLTEIDVSGNAALVNLVLSENQLTEIDVSANTDLNVLYLFDNQFTEIDVSANTELTFLRLNKNQLTEIDVSSNTALTNLWLFDNQFEAVDVSANSVLNYLYLFDNKLTAIDVSANTNLIQLSVNRNRLTEIEVATNTELQFLNIRENPLTQAAQDELLNISRNSFSVAYGYEAGFNPVTELLTIPAVESEGGFFRVELMLLDAASLTFGIIDVEEIVDPNLSVSAEFSSDMLLIPDVLVPDELAGVLHYRTQLTLIESEPSSIFQISNVEEIIGAE
jgi:hypothetical protein